MMNSTKILRLITSLSVVSSVLACSPQLTPPVRRVETTEIVADPSPVEQWVAQQPPVGHPTRIALVKDNTLSREQHRIAPLTLADILPLLNLLKQNGGEIALIGLCDDSDRPAVRVYIDAPPYLSPSALQQADKPTPPDTEGVSPFDLADIQENYQHQRALYEQQQQKNERILTQHRQALTQWQIATEQKLQAFATAIKPLLETPATCGQSDVWGAIRRSDTFLHENNGSWTQPPQNFLLLITDGLHNTATPPVQMRADAEVLLVNGDGESGVVGNFQHQSFEAVSAAVRYLVDKASHQEVNANE